MNKFTMEKGLLTAIKNADDGRGRMSATYIQVLYDTKRNRVFGQVQHSLGQGDHTVYADKNIIDVGNFAGDCSRDALRKATEEAIAWYEYEKGGVEAAA